MLHQINTKQIDIHLKQLVIYFQKPTFLLRFCKIEIEKSIALIGKLFMEGTKKFNEFFFFLFMTNNGNYFISGLLFCYFFKRTINHITVIHKTWF